MPLCPQITNTPITVTLTADFTVTNVIPVLPADTEQLAATNVTAAAALADAAAALAEAEDAYTAAIGSLQPSADTIVNASNQITAINGGGITVYSGASATTGARVVLNSSGLAAFNASNNATFSITASTGAAVFSGSVTGAAITGSSLNIAGKFVVDGTTGIMSAIDGTFTGTVTSTAGSIGGFNIGTTFLSSGTGTTGFRINSSTGAAAFGALTTTGTITAGTGLVLTTGTCTVSAGGNAFNNVGTFGAASVNTTGDMSASGQLYAAGHSTASNTANGIVFGADGRIARSTASSQRYKENITDLWSVPELDPKKLLQIPVRAFTYKEDYLKNDDRTAVLVPGLIAEEVDAIYPLAADYADGNVENINDRTILINLLALVQDLYKEIDILKGA